MFVKFGGNDEDDHDDDNDDADDDADNDDDGNDDEHKEGGVDMDMTTNGPVKTVFAPDLYYRFSQPLLHLPASSLLFLTTRL